MPNIDTTAAAISPIKAKLFGATPLGAAGYMMSPVRKNTCVIFGDSITAANQISESGVFGTVARHFSVANAASGHRLSLLSNAGVSSNTTTQMLARVETDVLSYEPGYVVFLGGSNDRSSGIVSGDEITAGTTIYNLKTIFDNLINHGIFVFACTLMPRADLVSAALVKDYTKTNAWIREYVSENVNCCVVDFTAALADPATGLPKTGFTLPLDDVHPSAYGGYVAGLVLAEKIREIVPPIDDSIGTIYDHLDYVHNPLLVGANADGANGAVLVAGTTGTLPNGMQTAKRNTGAGAFSQSTFPAVVPGSSWRRTLPLRCEATFIASGDGVGLCFGGSNVSAKGRYDVNWVAATAYTHGDKRNPTTANDLIYFVITPGTSGGSAPVWANHADGDIVTDGTVTWIAQKKPAAGDRFYAECDIALSSLTAGKGALPVLALTVIDTTSTELFSSYDLFFNLTANADYSPQIIPGYMRLRTPEMTIPSFGASNLRYLFAKLMVYGEAGGAVTVDICNVAIRRVE